MEKSRTEKIGDEIKKAEEFIKAADMVYKGGIFTPAVILAYYSAYHASIAAFLTRGAHKSGKDSFADFMAVLEKFNRKLDPIVASQVKAKAEAARNVADAPPPVDYTDNEALLRMYQTREFLLEVKDYLKRSIKYASGS